MGVEAGGDLRVDPNRVEQLAAPFREFRARKLNPPGLPQRLRMLLRYQFHDYYFVQPPLWRRLWRSRSWEQRPAPEFASIGVVRSGTSALANYIFQHPCVVLPLAKEPPEAYALKHVRSNFPSERERQQVRQRYGHAISGYCAPAASSIMFPYGAKALNPQMKIILIMRDPIERAFSHWRWDQRLLSRGPREQSIMREFPDFAELVDLEIADAEAGGIGWTTAAGISGYLRQSIYLPFMQALNRVFPPDQVHWINATEFFADPVRVTRDVYTFLGLPPVDPIVSAEKNAGPEGQLDPALRERLRAFFEPHNRKLYDYLGRDLGW